MERFEKLKNLGRGAQGSVILVRRKSDDSKFVIKQIFTEETLDSTEEIMNEIRVLAMLAHPNIVGYYGSFMEDAVLNVVMEYADNGSLFDHIQRAPQPFTEAEVLDVFAQMLLATDHCHAKHVIHRDLKTKNIFMTSKGQIKLGDFGLSKVLGSGDYAESAVGTPYYLSPELCEGKPYNRKSDVWALGCVLCELTTFKHAFDATNLPALVKSILSGEHTPIPPSYSDHVHRVIGQCLQKLPEDRPNVRDLLEEDFMVPYIKKYEEETNRALSEMQLAHLAAPRPFFEQGSVETAVTSIRRKKNVKAPPGHGRVQLTALLDELEQEEQFTRLVMQMRAQLKISDRLHNRVPYFQCFQGADLADFLVENLQLDSREEAVITGQRWMDAGVFYGATGSQDNFDDGAALYRFKEDEVGSILNLKRPWPGAARDPGALEAEMRVRLESLVRAHTTQDGTTTTVDYEGLAMGAAFAAYTTLAEEFQKADLGALAFNTKIAFFINLYNALVLHGFVVLGPPVGTSTRHHFFNHTCYNVGGLVYSLNDIAHGVLRGNQKPHGAYRRMFVKQDPRIKNAVVVWDPRIHFALVSGHRSCPRLRVYHPADLEEQLSQSTRDYCNQHVVLPSVFDWYHDDFAGAGKAAKAEMLRWVATYLPAPKARALTAAVSANKFSIKYTPVDWTLNKMHRPAPPMATR